MKILLVHNHYQHSGGEDVVAAQEASVLKVVGHSVVEYCRTNRELNALSKWEKLTIPIHTVWANDTLKELNILIKKEKPNLLHAHNIFIMISPAAYYACRNNGMPIIQTLHNYRIICPSAILFRDTQLCEDCIDKFIPWPGIAHACYHESHARTAVVASMTTIHHLLKTWHRQVDLYVALTEFSRTKFIQGGLPKEKIVVKPNFVHPDPGVGDGPADTATFVGRLSQEKGVFTLLHAWTLLKKIPLQMLGDGPLMGDVKQRIENSHLESTVNVRGLCSQEEVIRTIKASCFLVFPSECYETFGRVVIEAFACGVPVIASCLGAMAEIVEDGRTGLHFTPGDPEDLAAKVEWAWTHEKQMKEMGKAARREYELKYTAERNYKMLMEIYSMAIERAKGRV